MGAAVVRCPLHNSPPPWTVNRGPGVLYGESTNLLLGGPLGRERLPASRVAAATPTKREKNSVLARFAGARRPRPKWQPTRFAISQYATRSSSGGERLTVPFVCGLLFVFL